MKKDFNPLIESLKEKGLINPTDVVLVSQTKTSTWMFLFGAIGGAIAASGMKTYITAISNKGIKCMTINPKTLEFNREIFDFPYDKMKKLSVSRPAGYYNVKIVTEDKVKFEISISKKMYGFTQAEMLEKAKEILLEHEK